MLLLQVFVVVFALLTHWGAFSGFNISLVLKQYKNSMSAHIPSPDNSKKIFKNIYWGLECANWSNRAAFLDKLLIYILNFVGATFFQTQSL